MKFKFLIEERKTELKVIVHNNKFIALPDKILPEKVKVPNREYINILLKAGFIKHVKSFGIEKDCRG